MKQLLAPRYLLTAFIAVIIGFGIAYAMNSGSPAPSGSPQMTMYKHPQCGCCGKWQEHLEAAGFDVDAKHETDAQKRWSMNNVPAELGSCHTGIIDGYVIEGHVPASDIKRLLEEKPDAVGLFVPGMPIGSPGMESSNPENHEAYDVMLLQRDGSTQVFQRHEPNQAR